MQQISGKLLSIQVGLPVTLNAAGPSAKPWRTGIFKQSVTGVVGLEENNLSGDRQADLKVHGGPEKAVCVYPAEHYAYWQDRQCISGFSSGAFGENFTVEGLNEENVCIGDSFRIGEAVVQLSQPRQPCWKLARRWGIKDLALQVQATGWTGWYFRVIQTGMVESGMKIQFVERPHLEWSVARANQIMHHDKDNVASAATLSMVSLLSENWRKTLVNRVARIGKSTEHKRLYGE